MADLEPLPTRSALATEFVGTCRRIFEAYLAGVNGLEASLRELKVEQQYKLAWHSYLGNHGYSIDDVRQEPVRHELEAGGGEPQRPLAETTFGEFEKNLTHPGPYFRLLGRMAITFLYAAWEDRFRAQFAVELGYTKKDDFKYDLFGDLGYLRNAAVHNHGRASSDVANKTKTPTLRWFHEDQEMLFSTERIDVIIGEIQKFCDNFANGTIQWVQPQPKNKK